ncbi:U3 snoRNP protein, partial [Kickxella alabastrina]
PLLGMEKQKPNVRRFAAESLAFLIRKLRADSLQRFVAHVVADLNGCVDTRKVDFRDGLALLFFECMRQVNSQLHSRAAGTLTALLREMSAQQQQEEAAGALEDRAVYVLVASVLKLCLHHVQRDTAQQLWAVLTMEFDAHLGRAQRMEPHSLVALTGLLATATVVRKGSRVADYAGLFQRCRSTFELASEGELLAYERLRWLTALLMQCGVAEMVGIGRVLLDLAVEREPLERILGMALTLARLQWPQWPQIMLPYAVQLTVKHWQADRLRLLLFWATVFQLGLVQPPSASGAGLSAVLTRRGHVLFPAAAAGGGACGVNVARELLAWLAEPVAWGDVVRHPMALPAGGGEGEFRGFDSTDEAAVCTQLATRSAVLEVIARVAVDTPELMRSLEAFAQELTQAIVAVTQELAPVNAVLGGSAGQEEGGEEEGEEAAAAWADDEAAQALGQDAEKAGRLYWGAYHQAAPLVSLLGRTLRLLADNALQMAAAAEASALLHRAWLRTLDNVVAAHPANAALMDGLVQVGSALQFLASAKAQPTTALGGAQLASLLPLVERNLGSFQAALRLTTLQLLALFEQQPMGDGSGGRCEMISMAAALEATDAGFDTHKDRMNHLRRMAVFACNGNVPALYRNVFPRVALAQLSVNFRPVWADATAQLARLAAAAPELFWASTWRLLRRFDDERRLIEPGLTPAAKAWLRARAAECAAQTAFGAQPKVDGHALECPNAVRLARVFAADRAQASAAPGARLQELMARAGGAEGAAAAATERVDYANVQRLLLRLLADHGVAAAERHSRPLVRAFLSFARHALDWTAAFYRRGQVADDLELGAACAPR